MAARSVSLIRNEDGAEPIEVRVIRKWKSYIFKDEYCFLFVDKQGHAIEAYGNNQSYLESRMNLHSCYRVSNYLSSRQRNSYNTVPQLATVKLARGTTFVPIEDSGFPSHYFNFIPYATLPNRLISNFLLTDYIGRFDSITSDVVTHSGTRLLKFNLEDENENYIEVALWGDTATAIDIQSLIQEPFPCILAVSSMRIKRYQQIQLESTVATHVYINPDIGHTDDLKERFRARYENIPANEINHLTIVQLLEKNPSQNSERRFTCSAAIVDFIDGRDWYYRGCTRCNKKFYRRGPTWVCVDHPDEEQTKFIYCVNAIIGDETGQATTTLFDAAANSLLHQECKTLVMEKNYIDPRIIPEPLQATKGVRKLFHLQFNNRPLPGSNHFIVNKVVDPPATPTEEPFSNPPPLQLPATVSHGSTNLLQVDHTSKHLSAGAYSTAIAECHPTEHIVTNITSAEKENQTAKGGSSKIRSKAPIIPTNATQTKSPLYSTPGTSTKKKYTSYVIQTHILINKSHIHREHPGQARTLLSLAAPA